MMGCKNCAVADVCDECNTAYVLESAICVCPVGTYSADTHTCADCQDNCLECEIGTEC
jgi:hypothetical protein